MNAFLTDHQRFLEAIAEGLGVTTSDISLSDSFDELKINPEQLGAMYHYLEEDFGTFTPEERRGIKTIEELVAALEDKQLDA